MKTNVAVVDCRNLFVRMNQSQSKVQSTHSQLGMNRETLQMNIAE